MFFALLMSVLCECWNITEGWGTTAGTIGWLHQTRAGRAGPGVSTAHARTLDTRCGGHYQEALSLSHLITNNGAGKGSCEEFFMLCQRPTDWTKVTGGKV